MITKAARNRSYKVLMYGLSEDNRISPLPKEELIRRQNEIWEMCFGKEPTEPHLNPKTTPKPKRRKSL